MHNASYSNTLTASLPDRERHPDFIITAASFDRSLTFSAGARLDGQGGPPVS